MQNPIAIDSDDRMPEKPKFRDRKHKQDSKRYKITQNEIERVPSPNKWSEENSIRDSFDASNISSDFNQFDMTPHSKLSSRVVTLGEPEGNMSTLQEESRESLYSGQNQRLPIRHNKMRI